MKTKPVIGIDLGTTNSEVAIVEDGKAKLLKIEGSPIMPSVVSIKEGGEVLVGQTAHNNAVAAPESTIALIKRKMGKEELMRIHEKEYTPSMISSLILQRLKKAAESYLNQTVTQAVITVPAYFDEKQREATMEAADLAGLEVLRLLNEPTSAALCYAMGQKREEVCLVYDLGGGTFDVSIVDLSIDVMEVRASHGNTNLGGTDFDQMIYESARRKILKEQKFDISSDPSARIRLIQAAEAAKIQLSTEPSAEIKEEFLFQDNGMSHNFEFRITRAEFENMIRSTIDQTMESVREALSQANCEAGTLDRVILVGGSTRIPLVLQILETELGVIPQCGINPDTVVAQGAAIEAANLSGQKIGSYMVDITPHSLGTEIVENFNTINSILIRKNTPLPATASKVFYKCMDATELLEITAYQGESSDLEQCRLLGKFKLEGLSKSGKPEILIKFELDRNGLLNVTAAEIQSGISKSKVMKRIKRSDIEKQNLADLRSVKLNVDGEDKVETVDESKGFHDVTKIEFSHELEKKVNALLKGGNLDSHDCEELEKELKAAKAGEEGAADRLADLVYYMG